MLNRAGFSYLELLVVIVIISAGIVAIMRLMPEGMVVANDLERITRSSVLAESKCEEIRHEALGTDPSFGFEKNYGASGTFPDPDTGYRYMITDDGGANIKDISVTVWFDSDNNGALGTDEHGITLNYKIANRRDWKT